MLQFWQLSYFQNNINPDFLRKYFMYNCTDIPSRYCLWYPFIIIINRSIISPHDIKDYERTQGNIVLKQQQCTFKV